MEGVDYLMVFVLAFGTGLGATLGGEVARSLIHALQKKMKKG